MLKQVSDDKGSNLDQSTVHVISIFYINPL